VRPELVVSKTKWWKRMDGHRRSTKVTFTMPELLGKKVNQSVKKTEEKRGELRKGGKVRKSLEAKDEGDDINV